MALLCGGNSVGLLPEYGFIDIECEYSMSMCIFQLYGLSVGPQSVCLFRGRKGELGSGVGTCWLEKDILEVVLRVRLLLLFFW